MRERRVIGIFAGVGLALFIAAVFAIAGGESAGLQSPPPRGNFDVERAAQFDEFDVYFADRSFAELTLTAVVRRRDRRTRGAGRRQLRLVRLRRLRADRRHGVLPPLEIQNAPVCGRNPSLYRLSPDGRALPSERSTVRGAPARLYDHGNRPEIYTVRTTIVLFGHPALTARAAQELRNVRGGEPGTPLPPAPPEALERTCP
jgi:hypothetical protein